jgi:hypothetical protein
MWENDDSTRVGNQRQQHDGVAIETVKEHSLVSDHWGNLQDYQARCRKDRVQVQHHADLVRVLQIPVTFSWRSTGRAAIVGVAEDAVVGEVLETGQCETKDVPERVSTKSKHGQPVEQNDTDPMVMNQKTKL